MVKIGIRPVNDGREQGVRESTDQQAMEMAQAVAKLLSSQVKDRHGKAVECVIADWTIGGFAEAAACRKKFELAGVEASITVAPCWCYPGETMDLQRDIPKAVWGFNGSEGPGAAYAAALCGGHMQKGDPIFNIYGHHIQDMADRAIPADVQEKLIRFARCACAVAQMKGKAYLSVGTVSMGTAGSVADEDFFEKFLGMHCEYKDMSEVIRRIEHDVLDTGECARAFEWVKKNCREGEDVNEHPRTSGQKDENWLDGIKMSMILRDMMEGSEYLRQNGFNEEGLGNNAIMASFQGQRQWTDFRTSANFMETILNGSFDWNGIRHPYVVATEGDCMNGTAMLFGHLLSQTAPMFSDVRTYWSPESVKRVTGKELTGHAANGLIHLINSGTTALDATGEQQKDGKPAMKPFWEITEEEAQKCLDATTWHADMLGFFRGGGFSSHFVSRGGMPLTMIRLNRVAGLGPVLQFVEGYSCELEPDVHRILDQRTCPTWPTTWFAPIVADQYACKSVYDVMANWGANHGAIVYGHIGAELITLASMLRIPVNMHNVDERRLQRPSAWAFFGMNDPEGADFRACRNFGPRYR
ncbi:L-fucose isomerase [Christensenella timonensis]|uniref:L-fucose isomerase n=1 Tax=Christensenella timonensis TaxID=1816678 RepID=UPI0008359847|nr:L-fucose isomerase [Christensenella timonensis]